MAAERKNIFLIGRQGHKGDEDQLTEMLSFLWQEAPEALHGWLAHLGLPHETEPLDVDTQFTIPSGKRPDICIRSAEGCTLIESKLGSGFGSTQVADYLDYLGGLKGRSALVLLTERPEVVPAELRDQAISCDIRLIASRWHDLADAIGDPGEESIVGDFIQLLIREGLVKPKPLELDDWQSWNSGFNVVLRIDALLDELDPFVKRLLPGAKRGPGLTKRWIYRVWRSGSLELGCGLGAAASDRSPHTDPIIFAFVGNKDATQEEAKKAVGVETGSSSKWTFDQSAKASCGLLYSSWPCLVRSPNDVLTAGTFQEQVEQAGAFMRETYEFFQGRGFLPARKL